MIENLTRELFEAHEPWDDKPDYIPPMVYVDDREVWVSRDGSVPTPLENPVMSLREYKEKGYRFHTTMIPWRKVYRCMETGTTNVTVDALMKWDAEAQQWCLFDLLDDSTNEDTGESTKVGEYLIDPSRDQREFDRRVDEWFQRLYGLDIEHATTLERLSDKFRVGYTPDQFVKETADRLRLVKRPKQFEQI